MGGRALRRLTDDERDAVEANLGLVGARLRASGVDAETFDDDFQNGVLGLMKAVLTVDAEKGALSTHADGWIRQKIGKARIDDRTVHVPAGMYWAVRSGRDAKFSEKAAAAMADPLRLSNEGTSASRLAIDDAGPEAEVDAADEADWLRRVIAGIPGSRGEVLLARLDGATFEEIGERAGRSHVWARKQHERGVAKLRAILMEKDKDATDG